MCRPVKHVREGAHVSSANLHLPQKAFFSRGQCPIKESLFFRVYVTVCSVSMMAYCPEEGCSGGAAMFCLALRRHGGMIKC